jgi:hypothetical protein
MQMGVAGFSVHYQREQSLSKMKVDMVARGITEELLHFYVKIWADIKICQC